MIDTSLPSESSEVAHPQDEKRIWYRSTLFNACIIGGVGFMAPGLWNAMNSLGAGGAQSPFLINAANALVFGLSMELPFLGFNCVVLTICFQWASCVFSVVPLLIELG
jgi:hypothetical protein